MPASLAITANARDAGWAVPGPVREHTHDDGQAGVDAHDAVADESVQSGDERKVARHELVAAGPP